MIYREPHEVLCDYQYLMGSDLGVAFYAISSEMIELYDAWDELETLYGTSKETVEFLNQTAAAGFFGRHQRMLRRDILMQLARLMDPRATTVGKNTFENLSLKNLVALVDNPPTKTHMDDQLRKIRFQGAFVSSWRNLVGAHKDKDYAIGSAKARILPSIEYDTLKALIYLIDEIINTLAGHYLNTEIGYRSTRGAENILNLLKNAASNKLRSNQ